VYYIGGRAGGRGRGEDASSRTTREARHRDVLQTRSARTRCARSTRCNIGPVVLHSPYILFTSVARSSSLSIGSGDGTTATISATSVPDVYKYELSKSDFTSSKNSLSIGAYIDKADGSFSEYYTGR
jgi:hypothetical protein